jgi:hypothetical protein
MTLDLKKTRAERTLKAEMYIQLGSAAGAGPVREISLNL